MSKQSDGVSNSSIVKSTVSGDLCVLGGIYCVYWGSASYTTYTDWK